LPQIGAALGHQLERTGRERGDFLFGIVWRKEEVRIHGGNRSDDEKRVRQERRAQRAETRF
jgi:hypothetical protein